MRQRDRVRKLEIALGKGVGVDHRFSSWYPSEEDGLMDYLERQERSAEYAQNFGLLTARCGDDTIRVPHSYGMQRTAVLLAVQERREAESEADEA